MMNMTSSLSGFNELSGTIRFLMDSDVATRAVRKMVIAGLKPIGEAQKSAVRVKTGKLKRATGRPIFSRGTGRAKSQQIAKATVGINTGTSKKRGNWAPHGAIWAMGTQNRWTGARKGRLTGKPRMFRGRAPAHLVIKSVSKSAAPAGLAAMKAILKGDMPAIVTAARKRST